MAVSITQARSAKQAAKTALAGLPGVVGIGVTKQGDDYAVKVNLQAALPAGVRVPPRIAGVPVCVEVVGPIRKRG